MNVHSIFIHNLKKLETIQTCISWLLVHIYNAKSLIERNEPLLHKNRWVLKSCWAKEAKHERAATILFQLCETQRSFGVQGGLLAKGKERNLEDVGTALDFDCGVHRGIHLSKLIKNILNECCLLHVNYTKKVDKP